MVLRGLTIIASKCAERDVREHTGGNELDSYDEQLVQGTVDMNKAKVLYKLTFRCFANISKLEGQSRNSQDSDYHELDRA